MRRVLMLGLVLAVVGGIGLAVIAELTKPTPAGWSDPTAHVVDGLWFGAETPCSLDTEHVCSLTLHAALERVSSMETGVTVTSASVARPVGAYRDGRGGSMETGVTVTSASVARPVGAYRDGRGGTVLATTGGWVEYRIAMLGLSDGRRLMVGVYCEPLRESQAGTVPASCQADAAEVSAPRVGEEPWLRRGGRST